MSARAWKEMPATAGDKRPIIYLWQHIDIPARILRF